LDTTNVAFIVVDPVESAAERVIGTPVIVSVPTSFAKGVPDKVLDELSKESHPGPLERIYEIGRVDEKVEFEKV
jgi:hypothetical protein